MPCLWIRCFPVHAVTNSWLFSVLLYLPSSHCSLGISTLFVRLKFNTVIKQPAVLLSKTMFVVCSAVRNSVSHLSAWVSLCPSLFCVSQGGWTALFWPSSHVTQSHFALPCVRLHLYEPEVHKHAPYHSFLITPVHPSPCPHTLSPSNLCVVFSCISTNI